MTDDHGASLAVQTPSAAQPAHNITPSQAVGAVDISS